MEGTNRIYDNLVLVWLLEIGHCTYYLQKLLLSKSVGFAMGGLLSVDFMGG